MGFLCVLKMYHVRLFIVEKMGFGMAPKRCGIHSKPQSLLQKTCLFYASKTLAAYTGMCLHRMLWPSYAGYCSRTWTKESFGHFISKNRFLFI